MSSQTVARKSEAMPSVFDDFFKPWNEWFDNAGGLGRTMKMPAVNITENKNEYKVSLAAPGLKKEDFRIELEGNMLSISCEQEETKEEKDKKYTRKEYNYSSFSRSFNLPEEVDQEKIDARYADGVLNITLPRRNSFKQVEGKHIQVK